MLFINKLFFTLIALTYSIFILSSREKIPKIFAPVLLIIIFILGFLNGVLNFRIDFRLSIQFLFSISILFLIYPILHFNIDIEFIIKKISFIYALVSVLLALIINNPILNNSFLMFLEKYTLIASGYRNILGFNQYFFHMGTVPFLILPLYLFLVEKQTNIIKKYFSVLVIFIAIYLSSSRALYMVSFFVFVLVIYERFDNNSKIIVGTIMIIMTVLFLVFLFTNTVFFDMGEYSNSVKSGHLLSAIDQLDIKQLLIGDGLGSIYFSRGVSRLTAHTELTYVDLIRYFGVIFSFLITVFMIFPRRKTRVFRIMDRIVFCLYLLLSASNPTLFNSYGLIVVLWYWGKSLGKSI